jgi:hypothetical protein
MTLTGVLLAQNARYAVRTYLANRQKMIFTVYFGLLISLGLLVTRVTARTLSLVQDAKDSAALEP